ncbi:BatA and WFA domain-containing protein [Clostridium gasigenes]|uniref:vWA domain-containing protein n=1 Tax=Clostridium gasigenes TaxID=94869 RepID=UPI001C0B50C6|nr:VWA domain-containing protein [Clostridium gasigenes]MBU3134821.1 BatA and WFA domain-containing protein [Clostridium gasigenes]
MGFTSLWPLFLLITVPLLIMLYILKRKYKEEVISSSLLWKEVYKNTRATTPWEKFRKNIMFLLQLLILLLIIFALMKPFLKFGGESYKNVIIVLDNTASMSTIYNEKTRLENGKDLAKEFLNSAKDGTNAYIVNFDGGGNLLLSGEPSKDISTETINKITQSYGSGDINDVVSLVKAVGEGIGEEYETLIFTDKDVSLGDVNGKVVLLGNTGSNGSVDNISHKFIGENMKIIATVSNRGTGSYEGDFSLYNGDDLIKVETLSLAEGEKKTLSFELEQFKGEYLKGELSRKDINLEDNLYYHVIGNTKIKRVLIVTTENVFLEKAFGSIQNTEVFKTNDVSNLSEGDNYDLYVFDNVKPEVMPSKGSILFINPTSNNFFKVLEGGEIGEATAVQGELSNYLESIKFTLSKYGKLEVPYWGRGFLSVDESAIGFKGEFEGRQIAALTFDLHNSDLALKKEFPILIYELGEDLISSGMLYKSNFRCGEKVVAKGRSLDEELKVTYPNGEVLAIKSGDEIKEEKNLGLYKLNLGEEKELFSVNFPSEKESNTNSEVAGETESLSKVKGDLKRGINIEPFIILLAMLIVGYEWVMYKRGN